MKRMIAMISALIVFLGAAFFMTQKPTVSKAKIPTVGILQLMSHPALDQIHKGIIAGLKDEGYIQGKNLKVVFRNAENDQSNLKTMSQTLVERANSDVVVGIATPSAQALANTTTKTPIVLGAVTDPVGSKLVKSETHPGGNITGVSDPAPVAKQLALIHQLMPELKSIGVISTLSDDSAQADVRRFDQAVKPFVKKYGWSVKKYNVSSTNDVNQVAQTMANNVQAVWVPTDNTLASAMQTLVNVTNTKNIPIFPTVDTMVKDGGVATMSLSQFDLGERAGKMAGKLLKGEIKTATTPIDSHPRSDLVINVKQAEKIGLKIPDKLLQQAEKQGEVIK
ncbi:tryptophan ABC transporter substrate-binding protein [Schleiferilactobacillus harbinensis]|uniref:Tryptophan ABC transporter substrate-binding protein n=1 Tax=Schleiferilactobacillus harbinensis TaxID=304207 RepID=A0ABU7SYD6_9LACO|nr:tryptophan ABC transporter substrate-binding protein [Schleiferilactobacillus harbinensis]MCI1850399.1 ABC transporter substrate-binding protein [Schleiferilactobacillus harbinensis]QEU47003.1 ABC transporter substrate-binding protein [Schleiferilactobacillus harbinensis]GEK06233.1 ABC transporter substrate-binding protein [Schleiferilactobacillus harbinensis]